MSKNRVKTAVSGAEIAFGMPVSEAPNGVVMPLDVQIAVDWEGNVTADADLLEIMVGVLKRPHMTASDACRRGETVDYQTEGDIMVICGRETRYLRLEAGRPVGCGR